MDNKLQSFQRRVENISPISSYEFHPNDSLRNEYKDLYYYYCSKTGHKRDKSIAINKYKDSDLIFIRTKVISIAKDYLEVELLKEVQDELEFSSVYSASELKVKPKVADACWEIYDPDKNINRKDLIETLLNEYHIEKYDDLAPDEYSKRVLKTTKQWIRDNEKNLQIK